jgi:GAF domain-containing protein/HAMP domain-containing protein
LLVVLLSLTTISVLTVGYVGISSVQSVGESAQQVSTKALRDQAEEYLRQTTVGDAQRINLILEQVRHDAENTAAYAVNVFEKPNLFTRGGYWRAQDHMFIGHDQQYMNGDADVSSAFVPKTTRVDDQVLAELELASYMDLVFVQSLKGNPDTVAIYLGTERDTLRYYPNIKLGALVPSDFRVTQRPWYVSANPKSNPERKVVWSPVYLDATGKGMMVTAAAPVYVGDTFIGCVGIDFTLKDVSASVEAARLPGSGYSFLMDKEGHAIVLPAQGYQDILGRSRGPDEFGTDLSKPVPEFIFILNQMKSGSTDFVLLRTGGKELLIAYAPIQGTGWSLGNVVEAETVFRAVGAFQKQLEALTRSLLLERLLPIGASILMVMVIVGLLMARRLADPVQKMAAAAQQIGAGEWDAPLPQTGRDEIGVLAQAFSAMTVRLRDLMEGLERRVAERTRELERRATQIATGAEISYAASQMFDPDEMLSRVAGLIRERFDLYYVGVFLVDENGQNAVLRAGIGEAGRIMVEGGHKLAVGGASMVGWVCANAQARIALDVGQEAVRFANPLLPETRSEMALPLRARERVLGVLDIQSTLAQAFDEKDITALQGMADQIAVALENARLYQQAQSSLKEVERVNRLLTGGRWETFLRAQPNNFAEFHQVEHAPFTPEETQRLAQSPHHAIQPGAIRVPLKVRGQVIGALIVEQPAEGSQAADQPALDSRLLEAVATQAAQAMESARLFEESQRLAAREQVMSIATARMRESLDVDVVLKTAVQEVRQAMGLPEVIIRLVPPAPESGDGRHQGEEALA